MKNFNFYTSRTDNAYSKKIKFLWKISVVMVGAFFMTITSAIAPDPPNPGFGGTVFGSATSDSLEIDANFYSGNIPSFWSSWQSQYTNYPDLGDDWSGDNPVLNQSGGVSVPHTQAESTDGKTLWQQDGNWGNQAAIPEGFSFNGGSNKNGDFIDSLGLSDSAPYSVQVGGTGPSKNDITDLFLHTRTVDIGGEDHTILFFGAATRTTSGASYLDFEYNQAGVDIRDGMMIGLGEDRGRTVGDFILVVNYTGGGNQPIVGYRVWEEVSTGVFAWSEERMISGTSYGYITTNIADIAPVAPNKGYADNGAFANVTKAFQFVEGGVDITALELLGGDVCNPDATLTAKTRSSPSFTAELKDFSSANFPLVPAAMLAIAEDDATVCPSGSVEFNAGVSGSGASAGNVKWYQIVDNPSSEPDTTELINGSTPTLSAQSLGGNVTITASGDSSTLLITNIQLADSATYYILAVLTGADCGTPSDMAQIILNQVDKPIVILIEPSICEARPTGTLSVCSPLAGANYYLVQVDSSASPIDTVYSQEVLNFDSDTLYFTGLLAGYRFNLRVEKEGCEAVATCADLVSECPAPITANATRIDGGSSSVSVQGIRSDGSVAEPTDEKITAYPVPFYRNATVEFRMPQTERYEINLYDMKGNLIKQLKSGKAKAGELQQIEVDGQKLPEGMYLVRVVTRNGAQTVKLLKKE